MAQDSKRPIYPKGFEVTTDWQYFLSGWEGLLLSIAPDRAGQNNVTKTQHLFGISSDRKECKFCRHLL